MGFSRFITDLMLYGKNVARLRKFSNIHRGKRCFILGNGPSLLQTDLRLLKNEITFGLNRIYLLFEKVGFSTTYLVSINRFVIEQFANEIALTPCTKFISWYLRRQVELTPETLFIRPGFKTRFSKNPITQGVWEGATVTYVAMQLAYFMGFKKVILVGVDHSFISKGKAHELVTSDGEDRNHFDPSYFGKGTKWQLPDLETSERAYHMAKEAFETDGREIIDATIGGKLQVFHKADYDKLFQGSSTAY